METPSDEISLGDIVATLWSRRLMIVLVTVAFAVSSVAVALLLPEKYDASIVLSPVSDDAAGGKLGGSGGLLSQFGGLAALGGISLGGNSGRRAEALATLRSAALTEGFIADNSLLPVLFWREWDAEAKTWKSDDPDDVPSLWKAERKFAEGIRSISEDKKTGMVTLTITWRDPRLAAEWASGLVARANSILRARAISEAQSNLNYLNEQLRKTSVVELQSAIYGLIETQIKQVMVANGSEQYAFRVIDPARAAEERSSPKRAMICVLGTFLGGVFACVLALVLPRRPLPTAR